MSNPADEEAAHDYHATRPEPEDPNEGCARCGAYTFDDKTGACVRCGW